MKELFTGTGIAHSILLFAVVIALGLFLGRFKIKGVSIGSTWILFVGIILSHFGFRADPTTLAFVKDFGLILFVFSIGLQVGPGFFHSFKKGGIEMNLMAVVMVLMAAITTYVIHLVTGESLSTMVGVMSGAVTNTPGLGAAQQTLGDVMISEGSSVDVAGEAAAELASSYAVAYPLGVLGVIGLLILYKSIFKEDPETLQKTLAAEDDTEDTARRMHCEVDNPGLYGKTIKEALTIFEDKAVVSRIMKNGIISIPTPDTVLEKGDKVLLVTSQNEVDIIRMMFGKEVPMHLEDWKKMDRHLISRRISVTKSSFTGKKLRNLHLSEKYGVSVTRVLRSGIQLVASPGLYLQMGDSIQVVGTEEGINAVADLLGNKPESLSHPNLVPIFAGIALGVIFGMIPIHFPGIPQPVKLGLAGGPLIIAILLGYFGPKWHITTYTTLSANMMIREIGINLFLAAVGLGAGENFVSSLTGGGYWWILYGALITFIPVIVTMLLGRFCFKLNFYQICGLVSGSTTNPPALAFAQGQYGSDYTSVNYATVYPLSMFLRVLVAQLLILIAMA